jgi:hypothetical protein
VGHEIHHQCWNFSQTVPGTNAHTHTRLVIFSLGMGPTRLCPFAKTKENLLEQKRVRCHLLFGVVRQEYIQTTKLTERLNVDFQLVCRRSGQIGRANGVLAHRGHSLWSLVDRRMHATRNCLFPGGWDSRFAAKPRQSPHQILVKFRGVFFTVLLTLAPSQNGQLVDV